MTTPHSQPGSANAWLRQPRCWLLSAAVGAALGVLIGFLAPAQHADPETLAGAGDGPRVVQIRSDGSQRVLFPGSHGGTASESPPPSVHDAAQGDDTGPSAGHGPGPIIPLWLCAPFALLLASIALMPFINGRFWHHHYPDFAFALGAMTAGYYLSAFGAYGRHELVHIVVEYASFIALVGGLYVVSGGILIDIRARGGPVANTVLLAVGAIAANLVGTTGASVLLIRPFLRMNRGRLKPFHAVCFIFIVSNCGGCLTPIGDPPLYLGYLKGVPFAWTLTTLWPMWLLVNGCLLAIFFAGDCFIGRGAPKPAAVHDGAQASGPAFRGLGSAAFLVLLVAAVFIDPALVKLGVLKGVPVGAAVQIMLAAGAYALAPRQIRQANGFTFEPVKEVGFLFVGIFLTMAPALGFLKASGGKLGLEAPGEFYFATGALSAVLDNAPTYLSFLQAAMGVLHLPLNAAGLHEFLTSSFIVTGADGDERRFVGAVLLKAISLAAVFFGAMTYIGNGPNFMVKSIVESTVAEGGEHAGPRMPSFFGYVGYAAAILLPVIVLNWWVFIR